MKINKKLFDIFLKDKNIVGDEKTWPESWKTINHKEYTRSIFSKKSNHKEEVFTEKNILNLLGTRRSRTPLYTGVRLEEILQILHHGTSEKESEESRPYASGGALYPIEIYFINSFSSENFPTGLYHYSPVSRMFTCIKQCNTSPLTKIIGCGQNWIDNVSGIFVLTYHPEKNMHKYGWFGARAAFIEAGQISQNIQLLSEGLDLRARMIGYGTQEIVDDFLEIDGYSELSVAFIGIGKKTE